MFKIPTATLITLSGLVAAGLLLIALTGENVDSSMDAMSIITIPSLSSAIPTIPTVPPLSSPATHKPTATPLPQASPGAGAKAAPPESIPGLVRVTDVPSPTPAPDLYNVSQSTADLQISASTAVSNASASPTTLPEPTTVERSSSANWLILALTAVLGLILVTFGGYGLIRRRK